MPRLEDNSYATRSERDRNREPLEKVTTGTVTKKKKPLIFSDFCGAYEHHF